ncbi:protein of unknown function [Mucilaginibacter sp. OK268]|uniref:eCIS core domain-containing protein n=1 Tax=Mucilaginibacter sp. OK268 TaxID=1881048 RepID=UPI00088F7519|nr:DUF4157 domain-containing protein [Mucilaginibacter sp. OK268]SDP92475.1 protein of unknown function [Mucilaginibacter sp. OK268]
MSKEKQNIEPVKRNSHRDISLAASSFFQPKLTVNQPNDIYEQEADAMADKVMRMPAINENAFFKPAANSIQRKCQHCEEEEKIHRKETSGGEVQGGYQLDNYVGSLGSSGHALSESSRQFFEPRFGRDFSNVRIHTGSEAEKSAQSINALAYTTSNNIVFNTGQYAPESSSGKKLIAHELTHVVQQGKGAEVKTFPWVPVAAGAALGGAYAYWKYNCLKPCKSLMKTATDDFSEWYYEQTHADVSNNVWDAYGHCYAACCAKKRCGGTAAYMAGRGREYGREIERKIGRAPHDSYTQDVNNQELGRSLAKDEYVDCSEACQNQVGKLDLTAPKATFWNPKKGLYKP